MQYKDYYKTLGVAKNATRDDIKKAYRKKAIKYHPDRNADKSAEDKFKEVSEANEVLRDPEKRKKYDQLGSNWKQYENAGAGQRGGGHEWFGDAGYPGHFRQERGFGDFDEVFGGGGGFSEFFNTFFGGMGGHGPGGAGSTGTAGRAREIKGQDLAADVELSLHEAYHGTTRILNVHGEKLRMTTRPGAYDGQELRIRGKGEKSPFGGERGDIYIRIKIRNDENEYLIDGNDLIKEVPVDLYTALLGGRIKTDTLAGKVYLTVPRGTQSGRRLRLKGKGMPVHGKEGVYGNLFVKLRVVMPEDLNEEEIKLLGKLREIHRRKHNDG